MLSELADSYKLTLERSLEHKCGALSVLSCLKRMGKKVAVITEGPQDAQEWTLDKLGLSNMIDYLATTNSLRKSKVDGIYMEVLKHLNIRADEIVYVGDSKERDMVPAQELGMYCIHYTEEENVSLESVPLRINTLKKLEYLLHWRLGMFLVRICCSDLVK